MSLPRETMPIPREPQALAWLCQRRFFQLTGPGLVRSQAQGKPVFYHNERDATNVTVGKKSR